MSFVCLILAPAIFGDVLNCAFICSVIISLGSYMYVPVCKICGQILLGEEVYVAKLHAVSVAISVAGLFA